MKKVKRIFAILMVAIMAFMMFPAAVSAAEHLNTSEPIDFTLLCNKLGYEFTVYQVGTLDTGSDPYTTKYTSLIDEIDSAILSGETSDILAALDAIETIPVGEDDAIEVGKFTVTETSVEKTFENLTQGVYYVRATNYPAGVQSVTNSVFALPYYGIDEAKGETEASWHYTIDPIELATKVVEGKPTTEKEIIGSETGVHDTNYADADLGGTVNYQITSTTAGSTSMKLGSYTIYDIMSKGLTLDKDSFVVELQAADGSVISTLTETTDFVVNVTSEGEGQDTEFNVDLTDTFLQKNDFYAATVATIVVKYNAVLNKYATTDYTVGNPNEEVKLEYSNKNGVFDYVEGNTVYVYTYKVTANKTDEAGAPLAGSVFRLYDDEANAEAMTNPIAEGISDAEGKVVFYALDENGVKTEEEISLANGTYYAVEISAPDGYNVYGHVIEIDLTAEYTNTLAEGATTHVTKAPANGIATFTVQNTKLVLPETGGTGRAMIYGIAVITLLAGAAFVTVYAVKKRKASEQ